ncbi:AraC-like DNA-binding protein [Novosphingobium chloroacetimidivorans]|uniref:AraC-like DNA-binding protein n=1 Tax=Novosphingobium chloroacetimidivorans TaxID=1428314 RepID=A0A7W7NX29_9SPHN|nr:AraC family transcriptional regulator [Novosphingobium chloroacetimidivorans]MBB4858697.1 AraC-like DNA-binding protein [Novosphingobium chloroacetimidivorans]
MVATSLPGLSLFRADAPSAPLPAVYEASVCLIAQGAKRVALGDQVILYDAAHHLVVSLDLPLVGHVVQASQDAPYLCCKIDFDLSVLSDLVLAAGNEVAIASAPVLAAYPKDPELIDAACRLVGLLDLPGDAAVLAPLVEREILYRLLQGPCGPMMRRMAAADGHLARVARAAAHIRERLDRPLRVAEIAEVAGMSQSSFHHHFKAMTRLTPLEYQKQLRLQEARRLMLGEGVGASAAAFAVGYESPSQFSREYRRLFGSPPSIDIRRAQVDDRNLVAA